MSVAHAQTERSYFCPVHLLVMVSLASVLTLTLQVNRQHQETDKLLAISSAVSIESPSIIEP